MKKLGNGVNVYSSYEVRQMKKRAKWARIEAARVIDRRKRAKLKEAQALARYFEWGEEYPECMAHFREIVLY